MAPPVILAATLTWNETESKLIIWGVGGTLFAIGLFLRLWCQLHLHYRLKVPKALTTTGPYVYVRNPVYIANSIILIGVVILGELCWLAPLMFIYCAVVYSIVVRFEESHLSDKYGQLYTEYANRIPRWIPNFRRMQQPDTIRVSPFLIPGLLAEAPNLLLLLPFLIKDLMFCH